MRFSCRAKDAVHLWDSILSEAAQRHWASVRVQFSTLDMLRIRKLSAVLIRATTLRPIPFPDGPCGRHHRGSWVWSFTVSPGKELALSARKTHYSAKGKERFKIYGVQLEVHSMQPTKELSLRVSCRTAKKLAMYHLRSVHPDD